MNLRKFSLRSGSLAAWHEVRALVFFGTLFLVLGGCQKTLQTVDPALRPIQEMLNTQLPAGSTEAKVTLYLNTQGYPIEPSVKPGTVVAVIRKIDMRRIEPVTARVTFYFDTTGKLITFELQQIANQPIQ